MKTQLIILTYILATTVAYAQSSCAIEYSYDAAGNRIKRQYVCSGGGMEVDKQPIDTVQKPPQGMVLYPNPTLGNTYLDITPGTATNAQITIFNITGEVMLSEQVSLASGKNHLTLNTQELPAGVYFVRTYKTADGSTNVIRFVKVN